MKEKKYDYSLQSRKAFNDNPSDIVLLRCIVKNDFHSVNYTYKDNVLSTSNEVVDIMVNRKDIVCVKATIPTQVVVKGNYSTFKIYTNDPPENNEFTLYVAQPFSDIYNQLVRNCTSKPYDPYGYYLDKKENNVTQINAENENLL